MWVCCVCSALRLSNVTFFMLYGIQSSSFYNCIKPQFSGQSENGQYLLWKLEKRRWQRTLTENKGSRGSVFIVFQLPTRQLRKKLLSILKMLLSWCLPILNHVSRAPQTGFTSCCHCLQSNFGEFSASDSAGAHNLALLFECMAVPHNLSVFQCIRLTFISLSTQLICQKNPLQCLERCLQTECPSSTQAVI